MGMLSLGQTLFPEYGYTCMGHNIQEERRSTLRRERPPEGALMATLASGHSAVHRSIRRPETRLKVISVETRYADLGFGNGTSQSIATSRCTSRLPYSFERRCLM